MKTLIKIATFILCCTVFAPLGLAADAADRAIIGFSEDGKRFAFEEYGEHDGSGFPYSNIYILDLEKDKWLEDPVRVMIKDENATTYNARHEALKQAAPLIEKYGTIFPAKLLASNAVGEKTANPNEMTFKRYHNVSQTWTVKLSEISMEKTGDCVAYPEDVKGFALSTFTKDKEAKEVYRDEKLPKSRGCPTGYRLADVIAFGESAKNNRVVVLVHKLTYGFEGRDARFLAVPVELHSWR